MNDELKRTSETKGEPQSQKKVLWQAIGFAWDLGMMVVVPLVGLAVLGRFLDSKLNTKPWLFLGGVIVSIVVSTLVVITRLNSIISKITTNSKPKH